MHRKELLDFVTPSRAPSRAWARFATTRVLVLVLVGGLPVIPRRIAIVLAARTGGIGATRRGKVPDDSQASTGAAFRSGSLPIPAAPPPWSGSLRIPATITKFGMVVRAEAHAPPQVPRDVERRLIEPHTLRRVRIVLSVDGHRLRGNLCVRLVVRGHKRELGPWHAELRRASEELFGHKGRHAGPHAPAASNIVCRQDESAADR